MAVPYIFANTPGGQSIPLSELDDNFTYVLGQISNAPVTQTANFTITTPTNWVIVNNSGTTTVTLPAASSFTGSAITLKTIQNQALISASSNVVPLIGGAAGTAILSATAGKWATLVSDGTSWIIMAGN